MSFQIEPRLFPLPNPSSFQRIPKYIPQVNCNEMAEDIQDFDAMMLSVKASSHGILHVYV